MKLSLSKITNPFTILAVSWLGCLALYSFGWTDIFPKLSFSLYMFIAGFVTVFLITGIFFNKIRPYIIPTGPVNVNYNTLIVVNIILYGANFVYSGIPAFNGIRTDNFGIPVEIVLATSLNGFTAVFCYYLFLKTRQKKFMFYAMLCLSFFMLDFSRGNTLITIVTMFFLWINVKLPLLTIKKLIAITSVVLLIAYVFGVAGNYRTINEVNDKDPTFDKTYNSDVILSIGGASDSFKDSLVPDEFFWSYLYLTSPLSNLQYNIDRKSPDFTIAGVFYLFVDEILFDSVSKRLNDVLGRARPDMPLLVDQLTVPTILTGSYNYAGWGGMVIMMSFLWLLPFGYAITVLKNPLAIVGISTLCTVYFFSIFDNMIIFSGLSLQLFYPFLFIRRSKV